MEFRRTVATSGWMDSTHISSVGRVMDSALRRFFVVPEGLFFPAVDLWNLSYRVPWLCTRDQVSKARVGRDVTESREVVGGWEYAAVILAVSASLCSFGVHLWLL